MLNKKEKIDWIVTEERWGLTHNLHTILAIEGLYHRHRYEWMTIPQAIIVRRKLGSSMLPMFPILKGRSQRGTSPHVSLQLSLHQFGVSLLTSPRPPLADLSISWIILFPSIQHLDYLMEILQNRAFQNNVQHRELFIRWIARHLAIYGEREDWVSIASMGIRKVTAYFSAKFF